MAVYKKGKNIRWKLENIRFLHPPEDFMGSFDNDKMQARHKAMQDEKIEKIMALLEAEENPLQAMLILNPIEHIRFVLFNLEEFKTHLCLEETVLKLFYRKNTPFASTGDYDVWKFLFKECDATRLYKQGTPFPHERITAYRGSVTGLAKGLSWTISKEMVGRILDSWKDDATGGGTVVALDITRKDIMVYVEDKGRKEVILIPEITENAEVRKITSI